MIQMKWLPGAAMLALFLTATPAAAEPAPGFDCAMRVFPAEARTRFRQAYSEGGLNAALPVLVDPALVQRLAVCVPANAPDTRERGRVLGRAVAANEIMGAARASLTTRWRMDAAALERASAGLSGADRTVIAAGVAEGASTQAMEAMQAPVLRFVGVALPGMNMALLHAQPALALDVFAYVSSRATIDSMEGR